MKKPVILADDLTGSMDTGVQLLKGWGSVGVITDGNILDEPVKKFEALVIDSETRNADSQTAYGRIRRIMYGLDGMDPEFVYKKIDSTLRGNIGKELEAILDSAPFDLVLFVPALPWSGRTTLRGYHHVNGRLLTESDLAGDPFSPISSSYIPDRISEQTSLKTELIEIEIVKKGGKAVAERLKALKETGCRVAVADAVEDRDLQILAEAFQMTGDLKILPCGSAGLLTMMVQKSSAPSAIPSKATLEIASSKIASPVLILSGSPAERSRQQIEHARNLRIPVLKPDAGKVREGWEEYRKECLRVADSAVKHLKGGKHLVIDGAGPGKRELADTYAGSPAKLKEDGRRIRESLAGIVEQIADQVSLSGIMIFGGDTAFTLCGQLGCHFLRILGEMEPLVPFGTFCGGRLDGIPLITKAGGFGREDIISGGISFLNKLNKQGLPQK